MSTNDPGLTPENLDPRYEPLKAQHLRGQATVYEQNTINYTNALEDAKASLRLASVTRDTSGNNRIRYERAWLACKQAAERLAAHIGKPVGYPAWKAPPTVREEEEVTAQPITQSGDYKETGGKGPSGRGLPLTGPGSNTDPNWMDTGSKK